MNELKEGLVAGMGLRYAAQRAFLHDPALKKPYQTVLPLGDTAGSPHETMKHVRRGDRFLVQCR